MRQETADALALTVLGWLMGDDDLRGVFLGATGLSAPYLAANAGDRELLAATLDFVLMDDEWVLAAAEAAGTAPENLARARAALPGGATPHWT